MGAVYTQKDYGNLLSEQVIAVDNYFSSNPGKDISDCATALSIPYQMVYAIVAQDPNLVYLPSANTEVSFQHGKGPGNGNG